MSDLPDGWVSTTIKELAGTTGLFVDGDWVESKDQDPNGSIRLLQLADIGDGTFLDKSDRWINEDAFVRLRCTALNAGDVLVARMPDPLGRACLMPALEHRCVTVVDVAALRADSENIDNRWVMQTINSPQVRAEIAAQSSGTTRRRISRGRLGEMEIPLPPKAEQTRIADQLSTLLTRVQACNDRFDAIPALLKRFRQTVLDAATTGALTQDWRGAQSKTASESNEPGWAKAKALHALPEEWRWAKFSEFLSGFRSGTSAVPGGDPSAYPVLRSSSVRPMGIDFEDVRHLPNLTKVRADDLLAEGEVLFTRLSGSLEYVANCAVVRGLGDRKIYYPDRLFRARLIRPEQGNYFELCFASPLLRKHLTVEAKSTAGHQRISIGAVTDFPIPMPSDGEQTEIVRRVEALFALVNRIDARCTAARALAQRLTPLVLAKAFRGELVPQDPNDEPASALLARIASSNTAGAGKSMRKVSVSLRECAQAAINL